MFLSAFGRRLLGTSHTSIMGAFVDMPERIFLGLKNRDKYEQPNCSTSEGE
jgi:hypothetical protein